MYRGYPNFEYTGFLEEAFGSGIVDILENDGIIVLVKKTKETIIVGNKVKLGKGSYRLGVKGLELVAQWNIERLTKWIIFLTIALIILGVVQIIF